MTKIRSSLLIASSLTLAACGSNPPPAKPVVKIEKPKVEIITAKPIQQIEMVDPEALINRAQQAENWSEFAKLIHAEWMLGSAPRRAELEARLWNQLQILPPETIDALRDDENLDTQAWAELANLAKQPKWRQAPLEQDLNTFFSDAYVLQSFYPEWKAQNTTAPMQIAVMLPFNGQYANVAKDIESGIIKAMFTANNPNISLRFYDSSHDDQVNAIYTQAKQDGADKIIGPLRQEAIMQLALSVHDENILVLNRLTNLPFYQLSLKKQSEDELLAPGIYEQGFRKIGILTSQNPKDLQTAQNFSLLWQQQENAKFDLAQIDPKERDLRKPLANLLHETNSKARANAVERAIGEDIEKQARVRQDLDSIMIFDKPENLAVYAPQLEFYQSPIQMFTNQAASAKKRSELEAKPDLAGVRMLNTGFAIHPDNIDNIFEAFGWDSFWAQAYLPALASGECLSISKTGKLVLNEKVIESKLIWTEINSAGNPQRIYPSRYQKDLLETTDEFDESELELEPANNEQPTLPENTSATNVTAQLNNAEKTVQ